LAIKKRKKVAIVGFAPSWNKAPFADREFEIWGLNELYMYFEKVEGHRWDRWFEIHQRKLIFESDRQGPEHLKKLASMKCPVYMLDHYDDIPTSVKYPLEEIMKYFDTNYFTNSISYMLALAIYEGYEEIHVYGVDMATDTEYETQRASCEYFIGVAWGKGIKVYVPSEADLLKTRYLYGYQDEERSAFRAKMKARIADLRAKHAHHARIVDENRAAMEQFSGAIQDAEHILKNWG
jgi:hypothetical protein